MGTKISKLKVEDVVDGDTIKVKINKKLESLRLVCLDTEETMSGSKPVTNAGKLASDFAKNYFLKSAKSRKVHLEFDTDDSIKDALIKHRGNYGRLICHIHQDKNGKPGENYNLRMVREGWSPYFIKYGRSRLYDKEFQEAESEARMNRAGIWNSEINKGGPSRDYDALLPWWKIRANKVDEFRNAGQMRGALSVRLDYQEILDAVKNEREIVIFCDLQNGIQNWPGDNALIFAGTKFQRFDLWIPDRFADESAEIINNFQENIAGFGKSNYVYVTGVPEFFNDKPQIVLRNRFQVSSHPPQSTAHFLATRTDEKLEGLGVLILVSRLVESCLRPDGFPADKYNRNTELSSPPLKGLGLKTVGLADKLNSCVEKKLRKENFKIDLGAKDARATIGGTVGGLILHIMEKLGFK